MKVSDLEGPLLDAWVARCEGYKHVGVVDGQVCVSSDYPLDELRPRRSHAFSTDWAQGGPLIERERISIGYDGKTPYAFIDDGPGPVYAQSPLIAAMRCYVASKFGEEVPDDEAVRR